MSFICHIHNYTEYNEEWNVFSAFNPSKCTHTWSSGQPTVRRPGSSWGFGALLKGLTSVVDTSCQSWDSNPQPWVTSGFNGFIMPAPHMVRQQSSLIITPEWEYSSKPNRPRKSQPSCSFKKNWLHTFHIINAFWDASAFIHLQRVIHSCSRFFKFMTYDDPVTLHANWADH